MRMAIPMLLPHWFHNVSSLSLYDVQFGFVREEALRIVWINEKAVIRVYFAGFFICDVIRENGPTMQKWKFTQRGIEEIAAALNTFKDSFSIIHILHIM